MEVSVRSPGIPKTLDGLEWKTRFLCMDDLRVPPISGNLQMRLINGIVWFGSNLAEEGFGCDKWTVLGETYCTH